jgi:hypothetical protein
MLDPSIALGDKMAFLKRLEEGVMALRQTDLRFVQVRVVVGV